MKEIIEKKLEEVNRRIAETWTEVRQAQRFDELERSTINLSGLLGELNCIAQVQRCFAHKPDSSFIIAHLASTMTRGADDAWSGRSNDLRRAQHDGYIKEAGYWLRYCEFLAAQPSAD